MTLLPSSMVLRRGVMAVIVAATAAAPAIGAEFIIYSQNLLRFGHGSKTETKCAELKNKIGNVDVILLQELMVPFIPCNVPGTYQPKIDGPYGPGSYKEYYGLLYTSSPRKGGPNVRHVGTVEAKTHLAKEFSRPPVAHLLEITPADQMSDTTVRKTVWIVNFHAIWGKTIQGRRDEIAAMNTFLNILPMTKIGGQTQQTHNIIVGGDWNMPGTDWSFGTLKNSGRLNPDDETSLTREGEESQPYDHFVTTPGITVDGVGRVSGSDLKTWRNTVSDHMGIETGVTLP